MTARTPGIAFAADVSIELMLAWAYGLRRMARWVMPGQLDVVEVAALAGDEARVLDPLDRGAEDVGRRSPSLLSSVGSGVRRRSGAAAPARIVAAASRIAATMFW